MSENPRSDEKLGSAEDFIREANRASPGFLRELADFILANKKWWLLPVIIVLLLLSALIFIGTSGVTPFLYPIF